MWRLNDEEKQELNRLVEQDEELEARFLDVPLTNRGFLMGIAGLCETLQWIAEEDPRGIERFTKIADHFCDALARKDLIHEMAGQINERAWQRTKKEDQKAETEKLSAIASEDAKTLAKSRIRTGQRPRRPNQRKRKNGEAAG